MWRVLGFSPPSAPVKAQAIFCLKYQVPVQDCPQEMQSLPKPTKVGWAPHSQVLKDRYHWKPPGWRVKCARRKIYWFQWWLQLQNTRTIILWFHLGTWFWTQYRYCPVVKPISLVLSTLTRPPSIPLMTCSMSHLSMKVAFLVAITSAGRVSELGALMADPLYTVFHREKVSLWFHPKFLPKVTSEFHVNQSIHLPVLFPKLRASAEEPRLHSLDVRGMSLKFCLQRTKPIRKLPRLFFAVAERSWAQAISSQRISQWIPECYRLAGMPLSDGVTAHSMRAQAASPASLQDVPILDLCRAATRLQDIHANSGLCCRCSSGNCSIAIIYAAGFLTPHSSLSTACQSPTCGIHIGTTSQRRNGGCLPGKGGSLRRVVSICSPPPALFHSAMDPVESTVRIGTGEASTLTASYVLGREHEETHCGYVGQWTLLTAY